MPSIQELHKLTDACYNNYCAASLLSWPKIVNLYVHFMNWRVKDILNSETPSDEGLAVQ